MKVSISQKDEQFVPHVVAVTTGSSVAFPNNDPFFHNVFSLFDGRRFDLGLYEAGSSRNVVFPKAGVSYVFCNIHPDMSAVVVVVDTPYWAVTSASDESASADTSGRRHASTRVARASASRGRSRPGGGRS